MPAIPVVAMAPNNYPTQNIELIQGDGSGNDTMQNDGRTLLHVHNTGGANRTITIPATKPCDQGYLHDMSQLHSPTHRRIYGPFPLDRFGPSITVTGSETATKMLGLKVP